MYAGRAGFLSTETEKALKAALSRRKAVRRNRAQHAFANHRIHVYNHDITSLISSDSLQLLQHFQNHQTALLGRPKRGIDLLSRHLDNGSCEGARETPSSSYWSSSVAKTMATGVLRSLPYF